MKLRKLFVVAILAIGVGAASLSAASFAFSTGGADGRLASLSQPASATRLETETADDFILPETTSINAATVTGLIPIGVPLSSCTAFFRMTRRPHQAMSRRA
jgi:hypothetical protein